MIVLSIVLLGTVLTLLILTVLPYTKFGRTLTEFEPTTTIEALLGETERDEDDY